VFWVYTYMAGEWRLAPLFVVCSRGCCDPSIVAEYFSIPRKTVRSIFWALRRTGLLRKTTDGFKASCERILWVDAVVRGSRLILLYGSGRAVIVYVRKRALRGYSIPHHLLCSILEKLQEKGIPAGACRKIKQCMRSIAQELGIHTKTASLALRALEMLGCPGPYCLAKCE
jgi:hypothetical protein